LGRETDPACAHVYVYIHHQKRHYIHWRRFEPFVFACEYEFEVLICLYVGLGRQYVAHKIPSTPDLAKMGRPANHDTFKSPNVPFTGESHYKSTYTRPDPAALDSPTHYRVSPPALAGGFACVLGPSFIPVSLNVQRHQLSQVVNSSPEPPIWFWLWRCEDLMAPSASRLDDPVHILPHALMIHCTSCLTP
jgi:hypothetical protein